MISERSQILGVAFGRSRHGLFVDARDELLQGQDCVVTFLPNFLSLKVIPYALEDVLHVFVHRQFV
jgi:hypothetical protein